MFSFRTTPIFEQLDRGLRDGKVGVFCTQNSWDTRSRRYLYELFSERGNLEKVWVPRDAELVSQETHIEFDPDDLEGLSSVVVDVQDTGSRYFTHTVDVFRLMCALNSIEDAPSLYVVDHFNPAGRTVEGSMPAVDADMWTPKVAHRHGLTIGELCHLYHNELDAKYPLHIISAMACESGRVLMPWTIAPTSDIPGMFTCQMYSGGALWRGTTVNPGIGTTRPYEYIGAPFLKNNDVDEVPCPEGVLMRPCSFIPSYGQYEGVRCQGYQIVLLPGTEYHSLLHTLKLMGYFLDRYSQFTIGEECLARIADPVIEAFLKGEITFDVVEEHIKLEEQKWIRKAKRYSLYDDQPCRIK